MTPYYEADGVTLYVGDCLDVLGALPDASVHAVVTDPPYGLTANKKGGTGAASVNLDTPHGRARIGTGNGPGGFMGMKWDSDVPGVEVWREVLRVLKPGGHLLSFGGTRTYHRMVVAIEDAGFEIRDQLAWLFGSGFPKSLDVSKAIDKAAGAERDVVGVSSVTGARRSRTMAEGANGGRRIYHNDAPVVNHATAPATNAAREWQGWGTALKPAHEPIVLARKPLAGTVAANVLEHGTGALNIDGCRVGDEVLPEMTAGQARIGTFERGVMVTPQRAGRWPANVLLDEVAAEILDEQSGDRPAGNHPAVRNTTGYEGGLLQGATPHGAVPTDTGGASRFFYVAKASRAERDAGLDAAPKRRGGAEQFDSRWKEGTGEKRQPIVRNHHPTVKPVELMRHLVRLVTPPGGVVLDPFMGSGSTGVAAVVEGLAFVGVEREAEYAEIARRRIANAPLPLPLEVA